MKSTLNKQRPSILCFLLYFLLLTACEPPKPVTSGKDFFYYKNVEGDSFFVEKILNNLSISDFTDLQKIEFPYGLSSKKLFEKHLHIKDFEDMPAIPYCGSLKGVMNCYDTISNKVAYWLEADEKQATIAVLSMPNDYLYDCDNLVFNNYILTLKDQKRMIELKLGIGKKTLYPNYSPARQARFDSTESKIFKAYLDTAKVQLRDYFCIADSLNETSWTATNVRYFAQKLFSNRSTEVYRYYRTGIDFKYDEHIDETRPDWTDDYEKKGFAFIIADSLSHENYKIGLELFVYMSEYAPKKLLK